jgi:hypothetical protein
MSCIVLAKTIPKIFAQSANVKSAELMGKVIVGPESAARLGIPVGTEVDLGTLAYYHKNPVKRFWGMITKIRKNPFNI